MIKSSGLILTLFIFSIFRVHAQNGEVKGKVVNANTNQPVEFATVSVFSESDSTLVTGMVTNSEGVFDLKNISNGLFYLKIDFIGLATKIVNNVKIDDENPVFEIDNISLESFAENMEQFEFVDEKTLIETKIDKKVYNVSKDISVQGGTGLDVVKNMPSVEVDEQENISLRGDKGVQILVDGRPSTISPSQLLKQLPAESIEKIEVITNPSAKYNPEGMSGILNIITKKEKASGINGSIYTGYSYNKYSGQNGGVNLTYRKNKISINSNVGLYKSFWESKSDEDRRYYSDTTFSQQTSNINLGDNLNYWFSLGLDYFINKKNTFYIETNGWAWKGDNEGERKYNYFDANNELQSYSIRNSENNNDNNGYGLTAGWQTQFNSEDHKLDIEFNYYKDYDNGENINSQDYFLVNTLPQKQNTKELGEGSNYDFKVDYELPITDSLLLEAGIRNTFNENITDFYSESSTGNNIFIADTNLNNVFEYQQNVSAAYFILGKQFRKIGLKVGNRIEQTLVNTTLITTNEKNKQDYFSWFPSIHISYQIAEQNEFLINYSRRINRPNSWNVNPFASYSDPYRLHAGNPNLLPEFIDVIEINYLKFWKKFNVNISNYFRQVNDKHQYITKLIENNVFLSTTENLDKTQIYGGELSLGYNPKKWWRMNGSFNIWSSNLNNASSELNQNNYGWSSNFSSNFNLPKKWSINARVRLSGKEKNIQGERQGNYNVSLSFSKQLMKEKARLTLRLNDIFWTQRWKYDSNNLNGFSYNSNSQWSSRSINVSYSYNFGKMNYDNQKRQSKDKNAGDDLNIGGGSGGQGK